MSSAFGAAPQGPASSRRKRARAEEVECVSESTAGSSVQLHLPFGVSVPAFFLEEKDPRLVSEALQLGASAVKYARSAAQEAVVRELSESRTADLVARLTALEAQRKDAEAAAAEERARADARIASRLLEAESVAADSAQRLRESHALEVRHLMSSADKLREVLAAQADEHRALVLRLDGELAAARADERARADASRAELLRQVETARADGQRQQELVRQEAQRQLETARQEAQRQADAARMQFDAALAHARQESTYLRTVIERQGATLESMRSEAADHRSATERATRSIEGLLIMRGNSAAKGAAGESTLTELITRAFGMADDFALRDSSRTTSSGDMMVRMWGLQTMWDCKSHARPTGSSGGSAASGAGSGGSSTSSSSSSTSSGGTLRNVEVREIDKIKADLTAHPEVDVGFLVALHTGIAHHAEHAVDVERVSPHQTLVYINRLALQEDPVRFMQDVLRPLLRALRALKEAVGMDRGEGAESGRDAEAMARGALRRVVLALNAMLREIDVEKRDLADEKRQADARFAQRKGRLEERRAGLAALLASSHAAELGSEAHTGGCDN